MIDTTISFVLLLQDDYTGKDITGGGFLFQINGRRANPVRKPEGFYVFTGLRGENWQVQVEGYPYEPMLLTVHRQELGSNPVCNIRLFRRRDVMFPDCQHYEGVGIPGSQAFALAELTPPLRLNQLQREEGGTRILLQGYTPVSLVRQRFCMGTGKNRELFVITRQDDDGSYFTDHYFQTGFRKGAIILRAYGAVCSADGSFSIPVPAGVTEKIQGVQYVDEEVRQWGCLCATVHK